MPQFIQVYHAQNVVLLFQVCIYSINESGVSVVEAVPDRSGIEPDVASPFGSLIADSISMDDSPLNRHGLCAHVSVENSQSNRWEAGTLTVLDDGLVVLDRLQLQRLC